MVIVATGSMEAKPWFSGCKEAVTGLANAAPAY
jgi:hypothetical protein